MHALHKKHNHNNTEVIYINKIFTNNRVLDPKTTRDLRAVRLEVNKQLIPAGCDVSLQIAAIECLDQVT